MKKFLIEYNTFPFQILSEKIIDEKTGDKEVEVKAIWQKADVINKNDRRYRKFILENEIKRLQPLIENKEIFGMAYHPKDGIGETNDISHRWNKIWMEDDGTCFGNLSILPTSKGRDIQVLIKAGRIGLSSRGFGTVTKREEYIDGEKKIFQDINSDFKLKSPGDFVLSPSVQGAGIVEEIQLLENDLNNDLRYVDFESLRLMFKESRLSGFKGSFKDFCRVMGFQVPVKPMNLDEKRNNFREKLISGFKSGLRKRG